MPRLPDVLDTDELSLPELCAARLDGEVVAVLDRWIPIDAPDLPELRARALGAAANGPVIAGWSAAWVHGATPVPPKVAEFCVPHGARVARSRDPRRRIREVAIDESEITMAGGCRCTSVERTAFDLLRDPALDEHGVLPVVEGLLRSDPIHLAERLRDRFAPATRVPHRRLALARLARILG